MTSEVKEQVTALRRAGIGYKKISQELGISENTVKTFCRRNGLVREASLPTQTAVRNPVSCCLFCGETVTQYPGRKEKKFCSRACRNRWWNVHITDEKRNAMDSFVCAGCGERFYAYRRQGRKYCSHACYVKARFGGEESDTSSKTSSILNCCGGALMWRLARLEIGRSTLSLPEMK